MTREYSSGDKLKPHVHVWVDTMNTDTALGWENDDQPTGTDGPTDHTPWQ